jgi:hypothetical protein
MDDDAIMAVRVGEDWRLPWAGAEQSAEKETNMGLHNVESRIFTGKDLGSGHTHSESDQIRR